MSDPGYYEKGETTYFAAQSDQRFGYCLYVPEHFSLAGAGDYGLAIIVHGTTRTAQLYRSLFKDFAEQNNCLILAPLFPAGIIEKGELSNYKFIKFHDIRYDHILLQMVDEIAERYRIDTSRFLLHGFSGGAQYAHRFFYLHPERLMGVSIGAPGMVTLLDDTLPWHRGTGGMDQLFDCRLNRDALKRVPVQLVIGARDTDTWEITITPESRFWMEGVNDAGRTRLERLQALRQSYEREGIAVQFDTVAGVAHQGYDILEPVKAFFAGVLTTYRKASSVSAGERHD